MKPITSFTAKPQEEWKSPPYLGNGFIGLRPGAQPLRPAKAVVGGYIRSQRKDSIEEHARAPYPFTMDLIIHGISLAESRMLASEQTLLMENGELRSFLLFEGCEITVTQSVSRTNPSLCIQTVDLTVAEDSEIQLIVNPDFTDAHGEFRRIEAFDWKKQKDELLFEGVTDRSRIGLCIGTRLEINTDQKDEQVEAVDRCRYAFLLRAGRRAQLQMLASMISSFYAPDCHLEAKKQVSLGWMIGFDQLKKRHQEAWTSIWKARPVLEGNERADIAQEAIDVAMYGLFSSCHPQSLLGIPCFGWSQYSNYSGHIFWDMDIWDAHALMALDPSVARGLALYRANRMEPARRHAALYGYDGIQYPWESGITGEAAGPADADTTWGEHHVVPDAACMVWEYCQTTQDDDFVEKNAWPLLRDVARWILSRGRMTERGFEISDIVGVDEFSSCVKNNSHMNLMCRMALQAAIHCAERLGKRPDPKWKVAFDRMILPYNQEGAIVPHESAFLQSRSNQHSPGSAHFVFLHGPEFCGALPLESFEKTYHFDERIRVQLKPTPSVPCSTEAPGFTTPVFAAAAAFFGEPQKAAELFEQSYVCYAAPPFQNTKEYRKYEDGVYVTTYGAQLQAVLYGFCGLRIRPDPKSWAAYPAVLPEGWKRITVERAWIGGRPAKIEAINGQKAQITFLD